MKKIILFGTVLLLFGLSACKNDVPVAPVAPASPAPPPPKPDVPAPKPVPEKI
ncbi:hypothetical protein [Flavobacterium noncentrifugens]|uniref:hypothetical protein n=1 Tax=Flavobacterium noncentrifugens TaxID=1128970 RepID=UPI0015801BE0|nr:hypothetical protein [Flavobacterium noncentrifugens]